MLGTPGHRRRKGNMELPGSSQDPHRPNAHTYTHIHMPAHTDTHRDAHTDIHIQQSIFLETKINERYNHIFFKISGVSKIKFKKKTIIPTLLVEEKFNHQNEVQRGRADLFLMKKVWGEAALLRARVCPKCLPLVHVLWVGCCPA